MTLVLTHAMAADRTLEPGDRTRLLEVAMLASDDAVTLADLQFVYGLYHRLLYCLPACRREAVVAELRRLAEQRIRLAGLSVPLLGVRGHAHVVARIGALETYADFGTEFRT